MVEYQFAAISKCSKHVTFDMFNSLECCSLSSHLPPALWPLLLFEFKPEKCETVCDVTLPSNLQG